LINNIRGINIMAQIIQETITINIARLVKDGEEIIDSVIVEGVVDTLESVVQELVGTGPIVEITIQDEHK